MNISGSRHGFDIVCFHALSSVLSSCEPELQELMKQIDIMISNQRAEWQAEVKSLQLRLKAEGEELQASRSLAARQDQEV